MSDLSDGGGIYTQGITGNIHWPPANTSPATSSTTTSPPPAHGLYTDNGATFVTLTGNAEYNINSQRVGQQPRQLHAEQRHG